MKTVEVFEGYPVHIERAGPVRLGYRVHGVVESAVELLGATWTFANDRAEERCRSFEEAHGIALSSSISCRGASGGRMRDPAASERTPSGASGV